MCPAKKLLPIALLLVSLFNLPRFSHAQTQKATSYTTPLQPLTAFLKRTDQPDLEIRGQGAFSLLSVGYDDSLNGTFVYALPDTARQQLATLTQRPLNQIPALLTRKEVKAAFARNSSCPWLKLEMNPITVEGTELQLHLKAVTLAVPESREYLGQLLCNLARQINVNRQRRGIIAALNRALHGEEDDGKN